MLILDRLEKIENLNEQDILNQLKEFEIYASFTGDIRDYKYLKESIEKASKNNFVSDVLENLREIQYNNFKKALNRATKQQQEDIKWLLEKII